MHGGGTAARQHGSTGTHQELMEALAKLWHERHVDWSPILQILHSDTGEATVESINGLLAKVGCGNQPA